MHKLLEFRDVSAVGGGKEILKNISFSVNHGEILGIVGESGSGKSTMLRAVMNIGDIRLSGGDIFFEEENLYDLREDIRRKLRGDRISMVFQEAAAHTNPIKTIGASFYESMRAHKKIGRKEAMLLGGDILESLKLHDTERILNAYPFELSGGMNQRVGIALAMLNRPSLLLADEPTSALDAVVAVQIMEELGALREKFGTAIILVTHNIKAAQALTDNILVLKDGRVAEYGKTKEVLNSPASRYTRELIDACPQIECSEECFL